MNNQKLLRNNGCGLATRSLDIIIEHKLSIRIIFYFYILVKDENV